MSNIKENLLKMKNISELMVDLAYSAVFLQDKKISSEVKKLNEEMKELQKTIMKQLFKVRESDEHRMVIIEMVNGIRDISSAAGSISGLVTADDFPSIVKDVFKETDERVITANVSKNSDFANKKVKDLNIKLHTKANLIGIKRGEDWIFDVGNAELHTEDFVVAVGTEEAEDLFKKAATGKMKVPV